ncbi:MAG: hypothetical protein WCF04_04845, partial [Candidatus Nanopelagicales bacterium]
VAPMPPGPRAPGVSRVAPMGFAQRVLLSAALTLALGFGFLDTVLPSDRFDFNRLHIFLFNLCCGGFVLLWFVRGGGRVGRHLYAWLGLSAAYAVTAFLGLYTVTLLLSLPLCALVERARVQRFGWLPLDLLRAGRTREKFLHTSLLCLSVGVLTCSVVIINNQWLHLWHVEKLALDIFFLFYSFPISLATFAVLFTFMPESGSLKYVALTELTFWGITCGVVAFFVLILLEATLLEILVANALFGIVLMLLGLFRSHSRPSQPRTLLTSGLGFLVVTALTGVGEIVTYLFPGMELTGEQILMLHATLSLYGWNLSGLIVMVRWGDFPILRRAAPLIWLHWLTVLVLVPLGKLDPAAALMALPAFGLLVALAMLSRVRTEDQVPRAVG